MPPTRTDIILYAQTGCAITSCTKINDGINFELNTQNLPPIVTGYTIFRKSFEKHELMAVVLPVIPSY